MLPLPVVAVVAVGIKIITVMVQWVVVSLVDNQLVLLVVLKLLVAMVVVTMMSQVDSYMVDILSTTHLVAVPAVVVLVGMVVVLIKQVQVV